MKNVIGIGLGGERCKIAVLDHNGNPMIIKNYEDSSDYLTSAIYFESPNNIVVGECARECISFDSNHGVDYFTNDLNEDKKYNVYDKEFSILDFMTILFYKLKDILELNGIDANDAVIACPFIKNKNLKAITIIKNAATKAGFNVLDTIYDATAILEYYCRNCNNYNENILIYDLGGCNLNLAVAKWLTIENEPCLEIINTYGKQNFGGRNWTRRLNELVSNRICKELNININDLDGNDISAIRMKAEWAKNNLSSKEKVNIKLTVKDQFFKTIMTKGEFEEITKDLVDETIKYVEDIIEEVKLKEGTDFQVDKVLLVGGSSKMPMIQKAMESKFPNKVELFEPDNAVAYGAVLYADMIKDDEIILD